MNKPAALAINTADRLTEAQVTLRDFIRAFLAELTERTGHAQSNPDYYTPGELAYLQEIQKDMDALRMALTQAGAL